MLWSTKAAIIVIWLVCEVYPLRAEEIRIGHLETNDDSAINWLYVTCNNISTSQMRCDFTQTMVMKKKTAAEIDAEIARQSTADPVADFNQGFGKDCKGIVEIAGKFEELAKKGIGADGKPINQRVFQAGWPMMQSMVKTCKNPTRENTAEFFKATVEQDRHSCKVHSDHSQSLFTWDHQTNSWTTQEGPTGPCGTFVLGALTQDPKNHFWTYVEKHLRMNPKGQGIVPGLSCEQFPEYTFNYTWRTTTTKEDCDLMESMPD